MFRTFVPVSNRQYSVVLQNGHMLYVYFTEEDLVYRNELDHFYDVFECIDVNTAERYTLGVSTEYDEPMCLSHVAAGKIYRNYVREISPRVSHRRCAA